MKTLTAFVASAILLSSSLPALAGTIFVGPNRQHSTLQAGVNAAADGDTILVDKGSYSGPVLVQKRVTIRPAKKGKSGTVVLSASIWGQTPLTINSLAASGAEVSGLTISNPTGEAGIKVSGLAINVVLRKCKVMGGTADAGILVHGTAQALIEKCQVDQNDVGIWLDASVYGTLKGNRITNSNREGVLIEFGTHNTVTGNRIEGTRDDGIRLGGSAGAHKSDSALVADNKLLACGSSSNNISHEFGIAVGNACLKTSLMDNRVKDSFSSGMRVYAPATGSVIDGNKVVSSARHGIFVDSSDLFIGRNTCKKNGLLLSGDGIKVPEHVSSITLFKNNVKKNGGDGIDVSSAGTTLVGNRGKGNFGLDLRTHGVLLGGVQANQFETSDL